MPRKTQQPQQPSDVTDVAVTTNAQVDPKKSPEVTHKPASLKSVKQDELPHGATIETY